MASRGAYENVAVSFTLAFRKFIKILYYWAIQQVNHTNLIGKLNWTPMVLWCYGNTENINNVLH